MIFSEFGIVFSRLDCKIGYDDQDCKINKHALDTWKFDSFIKETISAHKCQKDLEWELLVRLNTNNKYQSMWGLF